MDKDLADNQLLHSAIRNGRSYFYVRVPPYGSYLIFKVYNTDQWLTTPVVFIRSKKSIEASETYLSNIELFWYNYFVRLHTVYRGDSSDRPLKGDYLCAIHLNGSGGGGGGGGNPTSFAQTNAGRCSTR